VNAEQVLMIGAGFPHPQMLRISGADHGL